MSWPSASTVPELALTMPQTMLISVVLPAPFGPEQREDLAAADVEVDVLERLEARGVGLADVADGHGDVVGGVVRVVGHAQAPARGSKDPTPSPWTPIRRSSAEAASRVGANRRRYASFGSASSATTRLRPRAFAMYSARSAASIRCFGRHRLRGRTALDTDADRHVRRDAATADAASRPLPRRGAGVRRVCARGADRGPGSNNASSSPPIARDQFRRSPTEAAVHRRASSRRHSSPYRCPRASLSGLKHRRRRAAARAASFARKPCPFGGEALVETAAVGDAGEAVAHRQLFELAVGRLEFAHDAREVDRAGDLRRRSRRTPRAASSVKKSACVLSS